MNLFHVEVSNTAKLTNLDARLLAYFTYISSACFSSTLPLSTQNTAAGTLYVDKDVPLEPAGITQEHVNQFFSGQALLSDFAPLSSGTLHVPLDLPLEQPLEQSSDDIGIRSKSARDSSQAEKGVSTAGTAAYGVTRRKSFNELDYLYRAAKLNNKAEKKKAAEHSFWGSNIAPALAELPSKSKHKKKGSYNGPEVAIKPSSARPRVRSELTSQEKELRDEALYASLVRMYELQARLEAEAAQKASVLGRMGRLFTFGGKSDKKTSADSAAPAGSISPVEGKKRKDKTGSGSGNDKAFVPVKDLEAEKVRTFASMFSLPSLFRRKE